MLDFAEKDARLIFSCGWHITRDGKDTYSRIFLALVWFFGWVAQALRIAQLDDQVVACQCIFESATRWTVVRGSDLEEGPSQGLPVWSARVGDALLKSNLTRRVDFALFMIDAITNDALVHEVPAIVSCRAPSVLALPARSAASA